jgi:peptide/nickel transport system substrate-binding protein
MRGRGSAGRFGRRQFLRLSAGALGAAGLSTPTPSHAQASKSDTLFVAMAGSPIPLDPATTLGFSWALLFQLVYNPLYSWDQNGKLYPDLAAGFPQISADGRVYVVKIKQGVKFHNGRDVTAEDVKYSIERATKPATGSWASGFITNLVGVEEVAAGKANEISGIKVVDAHTVQFTLKSPQAVFIQNLGLTPHAVVPREEVEKWGDQFGLHPVGTGPYRIAQWQPDVSLVAERHPHFHESGKPAVLRLSFKLRTEPDVAFLQLQRGEVDLLWDGIPEGAISEVVKPAWADRYAKTSGVTANLLWLNTKWPGLEDKRVRQAIALAVNRQRLLELNFGRGSIPNDIWQPKVLGYKADRPPLRYAPSEAKQLLDKAGLPRDFRMKIAFRGAGAQQGSLFGRIVASLQQDLQQVGISADAVPVDPSNWPRALKDPKFTSSYLGEWTPDYPDPYDVYFFAFSCSGAQSGTNRTFYCNNKLESLVTEAERQPGVSDPRRIKLYQQVGDVLLDDVPATTLTYTVYDTVHSARIRNFAMHPLWFYSFKDYRLGG